MVGRTDVRLWRQNTGVARSFDGGSIVAYGVPGGADLSGIIAGGRRLEIEVKTPGVKQSPQQINFERMITKFGGLYLVARSVEDVANALQGP